MQLNQQVICDNSTAFSDCRNQKEFFTIQVHALCVCVCIASSASCATLTFSGYGSHRKRRGTHTSSLSVIRQRCESSDYLPVQPASSHHAPATTKRLLQTSTSKTTALNLTSVFWKGTTKAYQDGSYLFRRLKRFDGGGTCLPAYLPACLRACFRIWQNTASLKITVRFVHSNLGQAAPTFPCCMVATVNDKHLVGVGFTFSCPVGFMAAMKCNISIYVGQISPIEGCRW